MGASNTLKIECDYFKDGKRCPKVYILPDDPKLNTPGVENTISTVDAMGNKLYFCGKEHMVMHWGDLIKAGAGKERMKNAANLHIVQNSGQAEDLNLEEE